MSCMSRSQFWLGFILGNIALYILLTLEMIVAFCLFACALSHLPTTAQGTGSHEYTVDASMPQWAKDIVDPDIDLGTDQSRTIKRERVTEDGITTYTTYTTRVDAQGKTIKSIDHEPFGEAPVLTKIKSIEIEKYISPYLAGSLVILGLLLILLISFRLLRNSACRLRDAGFPAWLVIIVFLQGLGALVLLVLFCFPSKKEIAPSPTE